MRGKRRSPATIISTRSATISSSCRSSKRPRKNWRLNIEKWVYFIKHAAELETILEKLSEPVFHKAFDDANRANMTTKELEAYDNSVTVMLDERGRIDGAYEKGGQDMAYEIARSIR